MFLWATLTPGNFSEFHPPLPSGGFFLFHFWGWGSLGTAAISESIVPAPDESWREIHPNATLSTTDPMWISLKLDLEYQSGKLVPL